MPITILDNEYASLHYHPETKIVHHQFHQPMGGQPFREVMDKGIEVLQEYGAQKWLSDDRANSALSPEDGQWAQNSWTPRAEAAGWKFWAVVMPVKIIGQMNMQHFINQYKDHHITVQVFSDPEEALRWLEAQ